MCVHMLTMSCLFLSSYYIKDYVPSWVLASTWPHTFLCDTDNSQELPAPCLTADTVRQSVMATFDSSLHNVTLQQVPSQAVC